VFAVATERKIIRYSGAEKWDTYVYMYIPYMLRKTVYIDMYVCVHVYIYIYIYICIHIHVRIQVNRHKKIIYMYCRYTQREVRKAVKSALALCNYAELTVHANCHRRRESGKMPSMRTSFARMYIYIYIYTHTHTHGEVLEKRVKQAGLIFRLGYQARLFPAFDSSVWNLVRQKPRSRANEATGVTVSYG